MATHHQAEQIQTLRFLVNGALESFIETFENQSQANSPVELSKSLSSRFERAKSIIADLKVLSPPELRFVQNDKICLQGKEQFSL
jgi:hypothetical protein